MKNRLATALTWALATSPFWTMALAAFIAAATGYTPAA